MGWCTAEDATAAQQWGHQVCVCVCAYSNPVLQNRSATCRHPPGAARTSVHQCIHHCSAPPTSSLAAACRHHRGAHMCAVIRLHDHDCDGPLLRCQVWARCSQLGSRCRSCCRRRRRLRILPRPPPLPGPDDVSVDMPPAPKHPKESDDQQRNDPRCGAADGGHCSAGGGRCEGCSDSDTVEAPCRLHQSIGRWHSRDKTNSERRPWPVAVPWHQHLDTGSAAEQSAPCSMAPHLHYRHHARRNPCGPAWLGRSK